MPEGHTIHRLARDHGEWFAGRRVRASSPQGRFPAAAELDRRRLVATDAYGKHLKGTRDSDVPQLSRSLLDISHQAVHSSETGYRESLV